MIFCCLSWLVAVAQAPSTFAGNRKEIIVWLLWWWYPTVPHNILQVGKLILSPVKAAKPCRSLHFHEDHLDLRLYINEGGSTVSPQKSPQNCTQEVWHYFIILVWFWFYLSIYLSKPEKMSTWKTVAAAATSKRSKWTFESHLYDVTTLIMREISVG